MLPSSPSASGITATIDRWIDPERIPSGLYKLRRARIVVVQGWLTLGAYGLLAVGLLVGRAPLLSLAQVAVVILASVGALALVRWGGRTEPAAWTLGLLLALTPVFQASIDLGIRDPALALVMLAPLAGALTSGARLATVSAIVGVLGAGVLFALDRTGLAAASYSSATDAAAYALTTVAGGSVMTAITGVLYVRHTRDQLTAAEGQSSRLDAALRASEQRYRSLFDHVPTGMYRTAPDGRILLANAALARMIGAPSAEAARAYSANDVYADAADRERFRDMIQRDGYVRRFETRWRQPDGTVCYVRIDARAALDADGAPLFYEGAAEDVTAEREARLAVQRSEARFRALVQRSSDVVVVADADDRLTYVSPAIGMLLGHTPEATTGTALADLVHPDDRAQAADFLAEVHSGQPSAQLQLRLRHAEGHDVFVEGAATALYDDPAVRGLVLNLRDVTERMRAQAVLVQAKRQAEEVAALKSTFLANMSHEIRTPLTAILGFSSILGDEISDPTQREFVELIARSGRRLMDTLNSVLDLTRLDAGTGHLDGDRLDAGALVHETVAMFGPAAVERGVAIRAEIQDDDLTVMADEAALVRVLHNLVGNALKFTDEGEVVVSADRGPRGGIAFQVSDTGIGVDPGFLPRIFGEFEQESTGHGRRYEGVGLGLALSRQMVERMGGTISVESEKGVGTVFTVILRPAEANASDASLPLVLVVDDNEQARQVALHTLAGAFRVMEAVDGDGALAAVASERPDVALLDIHLGASISGEDVMRRLRGSTAFAALPMIAVTAYGLPGDRERFLAAGFDAYITKPYSRADLYSVIDGALATRSARPEAPGGGAYLSFSDDPPAMPAPPTSARAAASAS